MGWIGLGTGSEARKNFQTENPIFSIVYDMPSDTGNIIFGFNSSLAGDSKPTMTVTTTPNWEMRLASVSVGDKSVYFVDQSEDLSIVFDLMNRDILLPKDMALSIIGQLSEYKELECFDVLCSSETIEGLPPLVFRLSDDTELSIPPKIYMMSYLGEYGLRYYNINLKQLSHTEYTKNHIIVGRNILSHFYTVFEQKNQVNTIIFYPVAPNFTREPEKMPITIPEDAGLPVSKTSAIYGFIFIVFGVSAMGMLGFICFKTFQEKKNDFEDEDSFNVKKIHLELQQLDQDNIPLKFKDSA